MFACSTSGCRCARCSFFKKEREKKLKKTHYLISPNYPLGNSQNGWIEELPYGAAVSPRELGRCCSRCFNITGPLRPEISAWPLASFARCSKCHLVAYCRRECQRADWLQGFHKHECQIFRHCAEPWILRSKASLLVRLVGRILMRIQLDCGEQRQRRIATEFGDSFGCSNEKTFFGTKAITLRQLIILCQAKSKDLNEKFPSSRREFDLFLSVFLRVYGGDLAAIMSLKSGFPAQSVGDEVEKMKVIGIILLGNSNYDGDLGSNKMYGCENGGQILKAIYDVCRRYAFPIVQLDPTFLGARCLGLGLYLNFTRFPHSCSPTLLPCFEPASPCGPLMKAQHQLENFRPFAQSLPNLADHSISRFEFANYVEEFGTLFPLVAELKDYLKAEWLIEQCECWDCTKVPGKICNTAEKHRLLERFSVASVEALCPKCRSDEVVAGGCHCPFLDNYQLSHLKVPLTLYKQDSDVSGKDSRKENRHSKTKTSVRWPTFDGKISSDCCICSENSDILPSVRVRCLNCDHVFAYDPHFPYVIEGAPALAQFADSLDSILPKSQLSQEQLELYGSFMRAVGRYNLLPMRFLERFELEWLLPIYKSTLIGGVDKIGPIKSPDQKRDQLVHEVFFFNFYHFLDVGGANYCYGRFSFSNLALGSILEQVDQVYRFIGESRIASHPTMKDFARNLCLYSWTAYPEASIYHRFHDHNLAAALAQDVNIDDGTNRTVRLRALRSLSVQKNGAMNEHRSSKLADSVELTLSDLVMGSMGERLFKQ